MPHKVAVIQHLDKLTEAAQLTQAVNAIYVQEDATTGKRAIVGTNTDYIGIHDAIIAADPIMVERAKGRPGLVIGGGGACRAAVYALRTMMQCSEVYLVNRDARELEQVMISFKETGFDARCACVQTQDEALVLEAPVVIVGTIPDHRPQSDDEVRAREITSILFERASQLEATFLDMCYSPSPETQLMFIARSKGLNVVSGIDAFFYQAIASNSLWTKVAARDLPVEKARELVYTHLV
jgi:quinate dehydrogenase